MKRNKLLLAALMLGLTFTSCSNDDENVAVTPSGAYENGILISHEGNFNSGNASVSYISNDFSVVENNIFSNVNMVPLGDTAQSMAFNGELAYIIVNNSDKIEVVNRYTFVSVATISGIDNPRYMAVSNGKGYVTAWGDFSDTTDDTVVVIDLSTNAIIDTIAVPHMPDQIVASNDSVYVGVGIFDLNDKLTIINSITDTVTTTITVGANPNSLVLNSFGDLYVLTEGNSSFSGNETGGKLIKVNTVNNTIASSLDFATTEHPNHLKFDNNNFYYYLNGGVYKTTQTETVLPTVAEFSGQNFYDINVRDNQLFGLDAGDFSSNGSLKVFDLTTNTLENTFTLNIIPGEVYFN
ncbi:YncE family protein [Lacinutrix chionoecetis]